MKTRSDSIVDKRDEVVAQLRQLADLVQHDRWEAAAKLCDVVGDGFQSVFFAWLKNRQRTVDLPRGIASVGAKLRGKCHTGYDHHSEPVTEQLEACRPHDDWFAQQWAIATRRIY